MCVAGVGEACVCLSPSLTNIPGLVMCNEAVAVAKQRLQIFPPVDQLMRCLIIISIRYFT